MIANLLQVRIDEIFKRHPEMGFSEAQYLARLELEGEGEVEDKMGNKEQEDIS